MLSVSLPSREEGGAAGREEDGDGGSREGEGCSGREEVVEEARAITVTSPLASTLGDGERDFGQGGRGEPPVEDPSGEGRSIDGEGEGEGELGEGGGMVELGSGEDG